MTDFIPETIDIYHLNVIIEKLIIIGSIDNNVNGQCLNSPYYVKHNGKLYKGIVRSHSPSGIKFADFVLDNIVHVPMSEVE